MRALVAGLATDIRLAARGLRRSPGFTMLVVATLSLGIAATTTIYSLLHGIVLAPMPFPEPDRLVWLGHDAAGVSQGPLMMTPGLYTIYSSESRTLEQVAISRSGGVRVSDSDMLAEEVGFTETTPELAGILAARPVVGRWLGPEDARAERAVVVLAHDLWLNRYGGDPSIVGRTIRLGDTPHEVIGVMEEGFSFPGRNGVWVPYRVIGTEPFQASTPFGAFRFFGIARLAPDVTGAEAQLELASLLPLVPQAFPGDFARFVVDEARLAPRVERLSSWGVGELERTLTLLLGAAALLLLIACSNVANLLLVRAQAGRRTTAVRLALGAGRLRLLRLHLIEALMLAGAAAVAGCGGAVLGLRVIRSVVPRDDLTWGLLARGPNDGLSGTVLLFALGISVATAIAFAMIPICRSTNVAQELKDSAIGAGLARSRFRASKILVASEIALTMALLMGGALLTRSLLNLQRTDAGFETSQRLRFQLSTRLSRTEAATFHQSALERLSALPGVRGVGAVRCLPVTDTCHIRSTLSAESAPEGQPRSVSGVVVNVATEGYFRAMGVPLLSGRTIEPADHEQRNGAVVVSASTAELLWPGEAAVGRRLSMGTDSDEPTWLTVVGVVEEVKPHSLVDDEATTRAIYTAMVGEGSVGRHPRSMRYVVATDGDPLAVLPAVRAAVAELDEDVAIGFVGTMDDWVSASIAPTRTAAGLLGLGGLLALLLSLIGVYGVVSHTIGQRSRELGVRLALGAGHSRLVRQVLASSSVPLLAGVGVGIGLALALARAIGSFLVGVGPADWVTLLSTTLLLALVALLGSYVPARRVASIDPVESLRVE